MHPRLIDRRDFLRGAGIAFAAAMTPRALHATAATDAVYATAFQKRDGAYGVGLLSERGELLFQTTLPDRGHDICFEPLSRRYVVFARQPGTFAAVIDLDSRNPPLTITSAPGRHFYGHGVFSPDGTLLYATENDFDNARGVVGIYDARAGFARVDEFDSGGIGPHEMLLLDDGVTLAIANGGIETHPDFGRAKLNLATMKPSLVLIDRRDGKCIARHELPPELHQLSIRHMDIDGSGTLWFGCQFEGAEMDHPPLIGRARPGDRLTLIDLPDHALGSLRNYVGSVAANREAGSVAFTSPQGDSAIVLDAASGAILSQRNLKEVCGVAADATGFMMTTGAGAVIQPDGGARTADGIVFDNHIAHIAVTAK